MEKLVTLHFTTEFTTDLTLQIYGRMVFAYGGPTACQINTPPEWKNMIPPTAPLESDEIDIDTSTLDDPIDFLSVAREPIGGPYAAFTTRSGRVLEFHVPGALACFVKGPSPATACSFIVRNPDGSIEHSGSLGLDLYL